jgi:hypothetical protein
MFNEESLRFFSLRLSTHTEKPSLAAIAATKDVLPHPARTCEQRDITPQ